MPFWRTYYHIVWATKHRHPNITPQLEPHLYKLIIKKADELGLYTYALNGWTDHVHIVVSIPPKYSIAKIVQQLKGYSAFQLNKQALIEEKFRWQREYGALTVGEKNLPQAVRYVQDQKRHHQRQQTIAWLETYDSIDTPKTPSA